MNKKSHDIKNISPNKHKFHTGVYKIHNIDKYIGDYTKNNF